MTTIRLNKWLARMTPLSRRAADGAIAAGEIRVNGRPVTTMGATVDPAHDRVTWKGVPVYSTRLPQVYLAFYKPRHTLVTKSDPRGRATIWDRLAKYRARCDAVGRLDFASEGLLLITDDGALLHRLTHPRYAIPKRYHVKVQGLPTDAVLASLAKGRAVAGVQYQPMTVRRLRQTDHNAWLELTLCEGKYREIRTLAEAVGYPVLKLKRVAVGPIRLGSLRPGALRTLRPREVAMLKGASRDAHG